MKIHEILSTKERTCILTRILYRTGPFTVSQISTELGLSKGLVSKFFTMLVKEKLLARSGNDFRPLDGPSVRALKLLLNLNSMDPRIFKNFKSVKGAGIFGSHVKGNNTEDSDIDIYLIVDKIDDREQARLTRALRDRYGNINPLFLTKEKLADLKKRNEMFYHSLVFGSITVFGDGIETTQV